MSRCDCRRSPRRLLQHYLNQKFVYNCWWYFLLLIYILDKPFSIYPEILTDPEVYIFFRFIPVSRMSLSVIGLHDVSIEMLKWQSLFSVLISGWEITFVKNVMNASTIVWGLGSFPKKKHYTWHSRVFIFLTNKFPKKLRITFKIFLVIV